MILPSSATPQLPSIPRTLFLDSFRVADYPPVDQFSPALGIYPLQIGRKAKQSKERHLKLRLNNELLAWQL
jgi:hypothetical protein